MIALHTSETIEFVHKTQIVAVEAMENYSKVYLIDQSHILATHSFGKLTEELNSGFFFQSHKSFMINLTYLIRYYKSGRAELKTGLHVPVARRRKEAFMSFVKAKYQPHNPNINLT